MPRYDRLAFIRLIAAAVIVAGSLPVSRCLYGDEDKPTSPNVSTELNSHVERYRSTIRPLLKGLCFDCHGPKKQEGDFRVDDLDPAELMLTKIDHWIDVGDRLKSGTMPPRKARQPSREELSAIIAWLTDYLRYATQAAETDRPLRLRRMTVDQYDFAMRDLIGMPFDFSKDLPAESVAVDYFSNDAEVLEFSPLHIEYFMKNAELALSRAIVSGSRPKSQTFVIDLKAIAADIRQKTGQTKGRHRFEIAGTVESSSDDASSKKGPKPIVRVSPSPRANLAPGALQLDGNATSANDDSPDYPLSVQLPQWPSSGPIRILVKARCSLPEGFDHGLVKVDLTWRGNSGLYTISEAGLIRLQDTDSQASTFELICRAENLNWPVKVRGKGNKEPQFQFVNPFLAADAGTTPEIVIEEIQLQWPYYKTWPPKTHRTILFENQRSAVDDAYVRDVLKHFIARAQRKAADAAFVDRVMSLYQHARDDGEAFEAAVREALAAVLASPGFHYLNHGTLPEASDSSTLDNAAIIDRLSFWLWQSIPDRPLLKLSADTKPITTDQLVAEAERMLKHPKAWRFIEQFTSEWLDLDGLQRVAVSEEHFPEFRPHMKQLFRQETVHYFGEVLLNNRSCFDFIDSDYMVLNDRLAKHYGVANVVDSSFRPVPAVDGRGGILTHASIMLANSSGEDSHAIKRGTWLLSRILGTPPPDPPPDVPEFKNSPDDMRSLAEKLAFHRNHQACAVCHDQLDPWGIAFEGVDPMGAFRTRYQRVFVKGKKVRREPAAEVVNQAELPDGSKLHGVADVKNHILQKKRDLFVSNFVEKMVAYAIGRRLSYSDREDINNIIESFEQDGYRVRSLIYAIIRSPIFRRT